MFPKYTTDKQSPQANNKNNSSFDKKQDVWAIKDSLYTDFKLSSDCALLLSVFNKLGKKTGFCHASLSWLMRFFHGKSKRIISSRIKRLEKNNLIYVHRYSTRRGIKLKIITIENSYPNFAVKPLP